jgi:hypothetical protein
MQSKDWNNFATRGGSNKRMHDVVYSSFQDALISEGGGPSLGRYKFGGVVVMEES